MYFPRIFTLLLLAVLGLQVACSYKANQEFYAKEGVSITPAPSWVFSKDNKDSFFGEREIIFKLGDLSFAGFYINSNNVDFKDFVDAFTRKTLPQLNESNARVHKEIFAVNNYQGLRYTIISHFLGEEKTYFYAVEIPCGDKKIFSMSLLVGEGSIKTENNLKGAIQTLRCSFQ
ncbi:MAG TPA: hypothetical protein VN030_14700 [Cellvibrio sp.]|nr:hypothetical protein [Cellvibrio sp.]